MCISSLLQGFKKAIAGRTQNTNGVAPNKKLVSFEVEFYKKYGLISLNAVEAEKYPKALNTCTEKVTPGIEHQA